MELRGMPELEYELAVRRQAELRREARIAGIAPRNHHGRVRSARIRVGRAHVAVGTAIEGTCLVGSGAVGRS